MSYSTQAEASMKLGVCYALAKTFTVWFIRLFVQIERNLLSGVIPKSKASCLNQRDLSSMKTLLYVLRITSAFSTLGEAEHYRDRFVVVENFHFLSNTLMLIIRALPTKSEGKMFPFLFLVFTSVIFFAEGTPRVKLTNKFTMGDFHTLKHEKVLCASLTLPSKLNLNDNQEMVLRKPLTVTVKTNGNHLEVTFNDEICFSRKTWTNHIRSIYMCTSRIPVQGDMKVMRIPDQVEVDQWTDGSLKENLTYLIQSMDLPVRTKKKKVRSLESIGCTRLCSNASCINNPQHPKTECKPMCHSFIYGQGNVYGVRDEETGEIVRVIPRDLIIEAFAYRYVVPWRSICFNLMINFNADDVQAVQYKRFLKMMLVYKTQSGDKKEVPLRNGIEFFPGRCHSLRNPIQLGTYQTICTVLGAEPRLPLTGLEIRGHILLDMFMGPDGIITQPFPIDTPSNSDCNIVNRVHASLSTTRHNSSDENCQFDCRTSLEGEGWARCNGSYVSLNVTQVRELGEVEQNLQIQDCSAPSLVESGSSHYYIISGSSRHRLSLFLMILVLFIIEVK